MSDELGKIPDLLNQDGKLAVVDQGESCTIVAELKLGDDAQTSVSTLKLTLYNETTNAVINSRNAQNVNGANGGSIDADGILTMNLDAADNPIVDSTLGVGDLENHVARFTWTWTGGRTGIQELRFRVRKLATPT